MKTMLKVAGVVCLAASLLTGAATASPSGVAGRWHLNAQDGPRLCTFAFTADRTGRGGGVSRAAPCKKAPAGQRAVTWRMDGDRLELVDGAGRVVLSLKRTGPSTFEARTTSGRVLFLVRG